MGKIAVHEFITLDGVIDEPSWTMDYPFDPRMGEAIGAIMGASEGLLVGRRTFEMFAPAWSSRTAEDDPSAPSMNESPNTTVRSSGLRFRRTGTASGSLRPIASSVSDREWA